MKLNYLPCLAMVVVVAFGAPVATVHAQEDPGPLLTARIIQVKMGRVPEFIELQRQHAAARKAAGRTGRGVWQSARGPSATFQIITFADNWAEFDEPNDPPMSEGDWASWIARITDVMESSQLVTLRLHPDLSIPAPEGEAPNLITLRFRTVGQGQADDYHDWIKEKLVPGLRNAGVTGFSASKVMHGDNPNMWVTASRSDNWASMDGPGPFAEMSERQRNNLFEDANEMIIDARNEIYRFRPELSD